MNYFPGNRLLLCILLLSFFSVGMAVASPATDMGLVDVQLLDPSILKDMRYAATDNFTGQILYPSDRCVLRESVAHRLLQAQRRLTLLIVEQSSTRAMMVGGRMILMRGGEVLMDGDARAMGQSEQLQAAYFGYGEDH